MLKFIPILNIIYLQSDLKHYAKKLSVPIISGYLQHANRLRHKRAFVHPRAALSAS